MRVKRLPLYFLVALLASCRTAPLPTAQATVPASWQEVPIMPGAVASTQVSVPTSYHYAVDADMKSVEGFYLDNLKSSGWELLGKGDASTQDFKGIVLWFSRGQSIRTIDIWEQDARTHVSILQDR